MGMLSGGCGLGANVAENSLFADNTSNDWNI